MKNEHNWNLLERLSDSSTSADERKSLLRKIESDPVLLEQWKAFRILEQWPSLEDLEPDHQGTEKIILQIESEGSIDMGIKRAFPFVAAAALAASVVLAIINIGQVEEPSDITLDDVFGLPSPTIENSLIANL